MKQLNHCVNHCCVDEVNKRLFRENDELLAMCKVLQEENSDLRQQLDNLKKNENRNAEEAEGDSFDLFMK